MVGTLYFSMMFLILVAKAFLFWVDMTCCLSIIRNSVDEPFWMMLPKKKSIHLSTAASTVSIPSSAYVVAFAVLSGNP
jgi:hypothetical protein